VTYSNSIPAPRRAERPLRALDARTAVLGARPASPVVLDGVTVGLVLQLGLLLALAATVGLQAAGWATGVAFGVLTWALLTTGLRRAGRPALGPADRVTLGRTVLVGGVAALAADALTRPVPMPLVVGLTAVALLLDGVDGQVARRTGTASPLGARFDMEVDAFLILVLSAFLVRPLGLWVLAIGAMRYAFVVAGLLLPWLTAPLPPRFARKVVAAVQGVVLVVAVTGLLPTAVTLVAVQLALAALCWSFGRDLVWLARHRPVALRPDGAPCTIPPAGYGRGQVVGARMEGAVG
jgi:phosphatidylglycerophosphate synthase